LSNISDPCHLDFKVKVQPQSGVLCALQDILYLFKYNTQNFIPKTPTQSSVHVTNAVLDFYAFTPEGT